MDNILAFRMNESSTWAKKARALALAAERRHAHIQIIEQKVSNSDIRKLMSFWRPNGIVVAQTPGAGQQVDVRCFSGVPTVFMDCDEAYVPDGFPLTLHDDAAICEMAIRELLSIGCTTIAYVGWFEQAHWSRRKSETCREILSRHGMDLVEFRPAARKGKRIYSIYESLLQWLRSLPENTGIFAVNDIMAEQVINVAKKCGRSFPYDIAVIGVDADENIAERTNPTLSTIVLDFNAAAEAAFDVMDQMQRSKGRPRSLILTPPLKLARRLSSRRFPIKDSEVEAAVERIRQEACTGLTARDVLCSFGCSRRVAEAKFRRVVGNSILGEIIRTRIEKACEILADRNVSIGAIADMCGFPSLAVMQRQFKSAKGATMSAFRLAQKQKSRHQ